jgi:cytochrome oxidase Cu insertion factor (SCO1/SenC/PrrC family)
VGSKLALATVAAVLLAGCGASEPQESQQEPSAPATTASAGAGNGPGIAGTGLDGKQVDVADLRGRPVFVNVWSSW